jgi:hypothetical protein
MNESISKTKTENKCVTVVGCGGNIGSHIVPHLGRMAEIGCVVLVDRDVYEARNVGAQDITPADVGKPKAEVQANRLRMINPDLDVRAIVADVTDLPLATLRGDVIVAGLDSRLARSALNEKAWQLGRVLVDAGVDGPGLLARVSVFYPGPERACLQCGWQEADYEAIEQVYPCAGDESGRPSGNGGGRGVPPTGAPSALGALAAGFAVLECRRVLLGESSVPEGDNGTGSDNDEATPASELLVETRYGNLYVTRPEHNPNCRMPEHNYKPVKTIATRTGASRLGDVICDHNVVGRDGSKSLRVLGQKFITRLTCTRCGEQREFLRLKPSMQRYWCWRCHNELIATGFDTRDSLAVGSLSPRMMERSLESIGIRGGDVLEVCSPDSRDRIVVDGEYKPPVTESTLWTAKDE